MADSILVFVGAVDLIALDSNVDARIAGVPASQGARQTLARATGRSFREEGEPPQGAGGFRRHGGGDDRGLVYGADLRALFSDSDIARGRNDGEPAVGRGFAV